MRSKEEIEKRLAEVKAILAASAIALDERLKIAPDSFIDGVVQIIVVSNHEARILKWVLKEGEVQRD